MSFVRSRAMRAWWLAHNAELVFQAVGLIA